MAVSNAMPKRRVVSGSNLSPSRYCLIGILSKTAARPWIQYGSEGNYCRSGIRPKTQTARVFFRGEYIGETSRRSAEDDAETGLGSVAIGPH